MMVKMDVHQFLIYILNHLPKTIFPQNEYVPENFKIRQMRVEYKHSAFHGDVLVPKRQVMDGKVIILIENAKGTLCVITEFTE